MNQQKQNLAIAKACGWEYVLRDEREGMPKYPHWVAPVGWYYSDSKFARAYREDTEGGRLAPPNYLDSLDAMHEAEETLSADQCAAYARALMKHHPTYCVEVLDKRNELEDVAYETFQLIHATAAQRAEAFLKTLNLWEDGK